MTAIVRIWNKRGRILLKIRESISTRLCFYGDKSMSLVFIVQFFSDIEHIAVVVFVLVV